MSEITKKDWKLYRERIGLWQERHMERLVKEYIELLSSNEAASTRFWNLDKRIKEDKKSPGVIIELRKSYAKMDMIYMLRLGIITMDDLDGFSDELINDIKETLK